MLLALRTGLFAITILILAEDFQYILRVGPSALEQIESAQQHFCNDCEEEDNESKSEKEEESKKESKEEDENKNNALENCSLDCSRLAKNMIRDAFNFLSDAERELESPPPEQF